MKPVKIKMAELIGVNEKEIKDFSIEDTFNGNRLDGFICLRSDYRYGTMVITKVNDEPCEQIIYGTPKLSYPFNKNGEFCWPKLVTQVEAWEKLDGTNILAYHYKYNESDFVSFKTRLTPVVKNSSSFGSFLEMWQECLELNRWIYEVIKANPEFNLSFEMFGSRNPITVIYDKPLDVNFLFGVRQKDHAVRPPSQLKLAKGTKIPGRFEINTNNLTESYRLLRSEATNKCGSGLGLEGMVFYAYCNEPSWKQFKCKAEQIEQIHWASDIIQKSAAWTTALNTFEDSDNPGFEDYKNLLEEEYTVQQIEKSLPRLHKIWSEARKHMILVREINKIWSLARDNGFDIMKDKNGTMCFISQYFDKDKMKKIGTIVLRQAGLIQPKR